MALADQHGGPLKSEFGFATGHAAVASRSDLSREGGGDSLPLRLASPPGVAPETLSTRVPPPADRSALPQPAAPLAFLTVTDPPPEPTIPEPLTPTAAVPEVQRQNEQLASVGDELAAAVAEAETLRTETRMLRAQNEAQSAAFAAAEESLATTRDQLATALADAEATRATLTAERLAHEEVAAAAGELRARVTALEEAVREARVSVVAPVHAEVDELRAVIELQEHALAAAAARERAWDEGAARVVDPGSTRSYSDDSHVLFASNTDRYELLERSGPAPSVGSVVELSGGRTCRVVRVGPAPFPGARVACAYLEIT